MSRIYNDLGIHDFVDMQVSQLLESQRHSFNIFLALQKACLNHPQTSSISANDGLSALLVLDEYLDRLVPSVRRNLICRLKSLVRTVPEFPIEISVVVITHSRGVLTDYDAACVVMHNGRIFHTTNESKNVRLPFQLRLIE